MITLKEIPPGTYITYNSVGYFKISNLMMYKPLDYDFYKIEIDTVPCNYRIVGNVAQGLV